MNIYHIDDGAEWWIAAENEDAALDQWALGHLESGYRGTAEQLFEEFDGPEVKRLQLIAAAGVKVRHQDRYGSCPNCGGTGQVPHFDSLLVVFHADQKLPEEKRAKHGILACSER